MKRKSDRTTPPQKNGDFLAKSSPPPKRQKKTLEYRYERRYYTRARANEILAYLKTMPFDSKTEIVLCGHKVVIPRLQAGYGEPGTTYRYSGSTVVARDWTKEPILQAIADDVEREVGERPNFVLINCYRDGKDKIGWHSDKEADLRGGKPIVSTTFGAERDFKLRRRDDHKIQETLVLHHGSLLIMTYKLNQEWQHSVPPRAKAAGPRFNLTWRFTKGSVVFQ